MHHFGCVNRAFFYYDRATGAVAERPIRSIRYIAFADGFVSGHKESPLAPIPMKLGFALAAKNPVALDVVVAALMGLDFCKIPQVREAFSVSKYPLVVFSPEDIEIIVLEGVSRIKDIYAKKVLVPAEPSRGWRGYIEYREVQKADERPDL